jgi:citrate synthase
MNMVAFIGRCLTSVGAAMGAALLAAMCNTQASFNGLDTPRIEALWDELLADRDLESAVARRLGSGNGLAGFNHLACPAGDPRAQMLLALDYNLKRAIKSSEPDH